MRRTKKVPTEPAPLPPYVPTQQFKGYTSGEYSRNMLWLRENWAQYKNMWVALNNGELLCVGAQEADVTVAIQEHPNRPNILWLQVGRDYSE